MCHAPNNTKAPLQMALIWNQEYKNRAHSVTTHVLIIRSFYEGLLMSNILGQSSAIFSTINHFIGMFLTKVVSSDIEIMLRCYIALKFC